MKHLSDPLNRALIIEIILSFVMSLGLTFVNSFLALGFLFCAVFVGISVWLYHREKKVEALNAYLQKLNRGVYNHDITDYSEGELSKLWAELNRTTITVRAMNERLLKQHESVRRTMEDIAHQLKTPIASLTILNEMLDQDDEYVQRSAAQIARLSHLTKSLLRLVKLESQTVEFNIQENDIRTSVESAVAFVQPLLDQRGIEVTVDVSDVTAFFDMLQTIEAISNVLVNKARFAVQTISIRAIASANYVMLLISDDGEPIEPQDRLRVFERFYSGINKSSESIGIGLSIAKEIQNYQRGSLRVEDANTFVFQWQRFEK